MGGGKRERERENTWVGSCRPYLRWCNFNLGCTFRMKGKKQIVCLMVTVILLVTRSR